MRAVIQRVNEASVQVENQVTGSIKKGMVILLGVQNGDTEEDVRWLAEKCINLRIYDNEEGKFHFSLLDIEGEVLVISQFTLYGDCKKGRRPSFTEAALPELAETLYNRFVQVMREKGMKVETGVFAARMLVNIQNSGPVTLIVDSRDHR